MTNERFKNWLKYYRASLIDSSRGSKYAYLGGPLNRKSFDIEQLSEVELKQVWDEKNMYSFSIGEYIEDMNQVDALYDDEDAFFEIINLGKKGNEIDSVKFKKIEIAHNNNKNSNEHT